MIKSRLRLQPEAVDVAAVAVTVVARASKLKGNSKGKARIRRPTPRAVVIKAEETVAATIAAVVVDSLVAVKVAAIKAVETVVAVSRLQPTPAMLLQRTQPIRTPKRTPRLKLDY